MKYKVELEIEITGDVDIKHVEEMLQFELGYSCQMSMDNPFCDEQCDCDWEVTDFSMIEL